jgi:hypothetical protein
MSKITKTPRLAYNRICTTCNIEKDAFSEFYESKVGYLGYASVCKSCTKILATAQSKARQSRAKDLINKELINVLAQFLQHQSPNMQQEELLKIGEALAKVIAATTGQKRLAKIIEAINKIINNSN